MAVTEIHTHTFVGGPFDGQKRAVPDDGSRACVEIAQTDGGQLSAAFDAEASATVAIERRLYHKGKVRAGETVYLYWRDEALDDEQVIAKLFAKYAAS